MSHFQEIKGGKALIRTRSGLYKELALYKFNKEIYAKSGAGFYKLYHGMCTSCDGVKWLKIFGVEHKPSTKGGLTYVRLAK